MASVGDRFYNEDVGYADMVEAPRRVPTSKTREILIGFGVAGAAVLLAVVLIRGSLPALTPEQIVQLDEYEGQQPPRHIFNLYSLKQERGRRASEAAAAEPVAENSASVIEKQLADDLQPAVKKAALVKKSESASTTVAEPVLAKTGVEDKAIAPIVVVESKSVDKTPTEKPVAAEVASTVTVYEKSELKRETIAFPVVAAVKTDVIEAMPSVVTTTVQVPLQQQASEIKVLPVYTIERSRIDLRAGAAFDARVLKILQTGQTITVFGNEGQWAHVATNDGTGTTGYVHRSMLY